MLSPSCGNGSSTEHRPDGTLPGFGRQGSWNHTNVQFGKNLAAHWFQLLPFIHKKTKEDLVFQTAVSKTLNHPPGGTAVSQPQPVWAVCRCQPLARHQADVSCLGTYRDPATSFSFPCWIECLEPCLDVDRLIPRLEPRQVSERLSHLPQVIKGL